MKKIFLVIIIILSFCVTVTYLVLTKNVLPSLNKNPQIYRGVAFTPKDFTRSGFSDFYSKAQQTGNIVGWYGDWLELADYKKAPYVLTDSLKENNLDILLIISPFLQSTGEFIRPLTPEVKQDYLQGMEMYLKKYQPKFLGIGIEVNVFADKASEKLAAFVELFNSAYDKAKSISPETRIFTVFQYEYLTGNRGGLFGGSDINVPQWDLLNKFNKADLFAFTSYPMLVFHDPKDIPQNYYSEVLKYTDKPVIFTELGWIRNLPDSLSNSLTDWQSTSEEQAEFITLFSIYTKELHPQIVIWSFLYDQPSAPEFFRHAGLLGLATDFTDMTAWQAWQQYKLNNK
ncbi:MAG TPA: hypothetical protein VJC17_04285 [Candidatus Dojkabacteria bacterium]|nr:hypothetical protein [Candidatus Dojkabacteria bacterium]